MARNSFGNIFRVTSFGESHGPAVGVIVDGFPAGLKIDLDAIGKFLDRRRPGQSSVTTQRTESDAFEILSGIFEGKSTGAPIVILIRNADSQPKDYETLKDKFRPSHADYTYLMKYGIRDHRGGGRSSARITAGWVAAGALAEQLLQAFTDIEIVSWVDSIYTIQAAVNAEIIQRSQVETSVVRCPDDAASAMMEAEIELARTEGNSLGGTIRSVIRHCPAGLGEPVFGKLNACMAQALFSINAVKGVEFGDGFEMTRYKGSEVNDPFGISDGVITTLSNHSGGIQGGISNGADITMRVAFKPTATISQLQQTVTSEGVPTELAAAGRHDPCVLPRAVPIVDAMAALVLADLYLENKAAKI